MPRPLPDPPLSPAQARALDEQARDRFHLSTRLLMENAGAQCAMVVKRHFLAARRSREGAVYVHCGSGGNGGDGYVCARHLALAGVPVIVVAWGDPAPGSDAADAARAWHALEELIPQTLAAPVCCVAVDAVLGIGLKRAPDGVALAAIRAIHAQRQKGAQVVAIDVPSGVDAETGARPGEAVQAHLTLLIAVRKVGLMRPKARAWTGRQIVLPFGAPARLLPPAPR